MQLSPSDLPQPRLSVPADGLGRLSDGEGGVPGVVHAPLGEGDGMLGPGRLGSGRGGERLTLGWALWQALVQSDEREEIS